MAYQVSVASWIRRHGQKYFLLIVWICGCLFLFYRTFYYFKDDPSFFYVRQILGVSMCISRGTASILNLNCGLILLPTCRCILTFITYLNSKVRISTIRVILESCKGFHKVCAITIILSSVIHVIGHIFNALKYSLYYNYQYPEVNGASYPNQNPIFIILWTVSGVTGLLMALILVLIVTSSYKHIRDSNYEVFYYTHRLIFIFYGLLLIHAVKESWVWIVVPLILYIVDGIIRIFNRKTTTITKITAYTGDVIELQLKCDGLKAIPGQYVLLKCPRISLFEWHPYSITKCPDKSSSGFNLCLRHKGDWSGNIHKAFNTELHYEDIVRSPELKVDGPYSSPLCEMNQSKLAVCIAGGIGVTPFISFLLKLRYKVGKLKKLYFIWIVRDLSHLAWFMEDILLSHQLLERKFPNSLEVQFYVTNSDSTTEQRHFSEDSLNFIQPRTMFHRPDWANVLSSVSHLHCRKTVDVFVCGPKQLIYDVRKITLKCCNKTNRFLLFEESF
ncbi:hypothetical protein LOTGIDRAFT_155376 [Lottia gigantea]|uniref:FAD-binding FR-type domain-containing protein n=1 Tax=Lottia gigantea TaxID=225164 RepID=V3ZIL4_LOTGI|nr:hypothetical protein LOTGIDRAFT_155376 [Lottia gigantea]ESO84062.1 hypothetical protein LOTGIDRAFT_155376 [Lottia gigantea]